MKKKGTYVALTVIMAVLLLGIGYAAVSGINLTITGTAAAEYDSTQFSVEFTDAVSNNEMGTCSASNTTNTGSFEVTGLKKTGDRVSFTYTIQNKSTELNAKLNTPAIENDNAEYFNITAQYGTGANLAPNATDTVTVTVELIKTPVEPVSANGTVTCNATPVAKA